MNTLRFAVRPRIARPLIYTLRQPRHRLYNDTSGSRHGGVDVDTMESLSRVKVALNQGKQTFGLWQMVPGANISRCLARAGADWICVDCEHGNMDG